MQKSQRLKGLFSASCAAAGLIAIVIATHHRSFSPKEIWGWSVPYLVSLVSILLLFISQLLLARPTVKSKLVRIVHCIFLSTALLLCVRELLVRTESVQVEVALIVSFISGALILHGEIWRRPEMYLSATAVNLILLAIMSAEVPSLLEPRNVRGFATWGDPITFRYLFPKNEPFFSRGGRLAPNLDLNMLAPHWFPKVALLRTNSDGFRNDDELSDLQDPKFLSVLNLGDSFAIGMGTSQEQFYGKQLERSINSYEEGQYRVLNSEISNPALGLMYLQGYLGDLKPKIIVYSFYGGNDLMQDYNDLGLPYSRLKVGPADALEINRNYDQGKIKEFNTKLLKSVWIKSEGGSLRGSGSLSYPGVYTRLFELGLLRRALSLKEAVLGEFPRTAGELIASSALEVEREAGAKSAFENSNMLAVLMKNEPAPVNEAYNLLATELRQFKSLAKRDGAIFALVYVPHRLQVQDQDWDLLLRDWRMDANQFDRNLPQARISKLCAEAGVNFIDVTDVLRNGAKSHQLYFWEDMHWNELGQEIAASKVGASLVTLTD